MRQWNISVYNRYASIVLFCSLILNSFSGCAKRLPPPEIREIETPHISFQEYISGLDALTRMKFLFTIRANRGAEEVSGNASFTVDGEEMVLRVYSLGFLVSEIKSSRGVITAESRKIPEEKAYLLLEALRSCLLWWDMKEREIEEKDSRFIVRNSWRRVYLYRNYIPEKQDIYLPEVPGVNITYLRPSYYSIEQDKGLWFPSDILVNLQGKEIRLNIERIVIQN